MQFFDWGIVLYRNVHPWKHKISTDDPRFSSFLMKKKEKNHRKSPPPRLPGSRLYPSQLSALVWLSEVNGGGLFQVLYITSPCAWPRSDCPVTFSPSRSPTQPLNKTGDVENWFNFTLHFQKQNFIFYHEKIFLTIYSIAQSQIRKKIVLRQRSTW